ncbi:Rieske (2Fe-2S) protein [Amycolatopsis rhizosphaerae]|uniref:Rieske (2Fe-2S) protein n=1 Tax=Amycolatopsis rhizosphaerae TaxID=2053003 RepID=A0A558DBR3_9PSEU|nr:Rieske (2Fe-2S) protein [Amycolatopsis rhizosphaerae]TVT58460.1 Rieske (2Fe-2S) protein [Amycolatopsis rhizosphaerae]
MSTLHQLARRVERLEALDAVAKPVAARVRRLLRHRTVRNLLSGTNLGHPLHPMLTDVPIGAWSMAALLDTVGGRTLAPAADLLVATGAVAAVPTAASGLNDWSDTLGAEARVGFVHAAANSTALCLYLASLVARLRGRRGAGRLLGLAGLSVAGAGAYLGGHLGYVRGVNVNRTAWHTPPTEWTPVLPAAELADRQARRVETQGLAVLLYRVDERIHALDAVCSHAGGPLEKGAFDDVCVTCPWHGSIFRLADGHIERGPASSPQPVYETRVADGQIQIRATG